MTLTPRTSSLVASLVASLACAASARAQLYQAIDLGVAPGFTESGAFDVNDKRDVTGTLTIGGVDPIAFVWLPAPAYGLPAGMTALGTLPSPSGGFSLASSINDCGQIVGSSSTFQAMRAFVWQNGVMSDLGTLAGAPDSFSGATEINKQGSIVGFSDVASPPFTTHPFLTSASCATGAIGPMSDLGSLGGPWAAANALNDQGTIVGESRLSAPPGQFMTHAFVLMPTAASMTDLGVLPNGVQSVATAVSERNVVAGWCGVQDLGGYAERVVLWKRVLGVWTISDLGTFNGHTYNTPTAIGDDGIVVGRSYTPGQPAQPFVWRNGIYRNLNDLVVTTLPAPILIEDALGMNAKGDIAAFGYDGAGQGRAFLLIRL